jgi:hypothetical protein
MSRKDIITMKIYQNRIVKCERGIKIVKHDGSKTYAGKKECINKQHKDRSDHAHLESTQPGKSNILCLMNLERGRAISIASSRVATRKPGSMQRDNQARVDILL